MNFSTVSVDLLGVHFSSSVWVFDNIWDPKIFMHLELPAADHVQLMLVGICAF